MPTELMRLGDRFPILDPAQTKEIALLTESNIGHGGTNITQLDRIKAPQGENKNFLIPGIDGDENARTMTGLIVAWRGIRVYHNTPYGEGQPNKPPTCKSLDGITGEGDPGGICADCPLSQFGSAEKGKGQACKEVRQLLFLRDGQIVPNLINVPPTSLKNISQYFLRLLSSKLPPWGVVTNISLEPAQNAGGIKYSRMLFSSAQRLSPEERALIDPFAHRMNQLLSPLDVASDDVRDAGDPQARSASSNDDDERFNVF